MNRIDRVTRLRLILTGVMLTIYFLVLAMQAHAQDNEPRAILQDEHTAYFSYNDTALSADARRRLDALVKEIKSQGDIRGARVVGFADHTGKPSYNETLSRKRAENVKNYLVSRGIVNASVADTRWFGDSFSATNCPEGLSRSALINCLQQDRRVEIEFDYKVRLAEAQ
jgi:outer membrane protein OmpA-like peptidoglycan-associated protein